MCSLLPLTIKDRKDELQKSIKFAVKRQTTNCLGVKCAQKCIEDWKTLYTFFKIEISCGFMGHFSSIQSDQLILVKGFDENELTGNNM